MIELFKKNNRNKVSLFRKFYGTYIHALVIFTQLDYSNENSFYYVDEFNKEFFLFITLTIHDIRS